MPTHAKTVSFSYDEAGNRIKREIIIPKRNMPKESIAGTERIEDKLSIKKVIITVDSNDGTIRVEIPQYDSSDQIRLNVFDIEGHIVYSTEIASKDAIVDLTSNPTGIYVMWININGDSMSYKLIKQ